MTVLAADVAIVGGGLIGCMLGYNLRKRGLSVVILERGFIGGESSGVSFGSLRLQGTHGHALELALRAQAIWEGVETEIGESVEFDPSGHVHLALDDAQVARLEANAVHLRGHGQSVELLEPDEIRRRWPFLDRSILAASWSPRDALVNPRLVAPAFARAALRLGAEVLEHAGVIDAGQRNGRFRLVTGHAVVKEIEAGVLVNATGAWSDGIAGMFGENIPVFPAGPAEIVTEPVAPFLKPVIHVVDGSVLFRQTRRGNMVIAGHPRMSIDAGSRQNRVPADKVATNLGRFRTIAPPLSAHHVLRSWTGIEGYVADMTPVVGPSMTTPGLFHICAFSGHGLQVGPAATRALAELIVTGRTDMPIAGLGIERFTNGAAQAVETMKEEFHDNVASTGKA